MKEISQQALLVEMQRLIAESNTNINKIENQTEGSFAQQLSAAIQEVNNQQQNAQALATRFEYGDESVSLSEVMIAMQKSNISLQAITQVRNKIVSAYQEIMNMPL